nr:MAG TPA: hypothetical protein [Bacteriophage sp.]
MRSATRCCLICPAGRYAKKTPAAAGVSRIILEKYHLRGK